MPRSSSAPGKRTAKGTKDTPESLALAVWGQVAPLPLPLNDALAGFRIAAIATAMLAPP